MAVIADVIAVTATQMLDSMIERSHPTRAEVSDMANAILDRTERMPLTVSLAARSYFSPIPLTLTRPFSTA